MDDAMLSLAKAIAARHGLSAEPSPMPGGSVPVFAVGEHAVLKLFEPRHRAWYEREHAFLERVHGRLGVPTPEVLGAGVEDDGPSYVLMTRVHGTPLDRVLPWLPPEGREAALDALGAVVARLHALPIDGLPGAGEDWDAVVAARVAGCFELQARHGLDVAWLAQLPAWLASHRPQPPHRRALVHCELGPGHVLADAEGTITGLIDFADAAIADPDLELPAVGIFIARGDARLYRRFLAALGRDVPAERALVYTLLHRYANLAWYLREVPPPPDVTTLDELAHAWFGGA